MTSLFLIGAAFALFFAVLLFNKPQQGLADRILCAWFLVMVVHLLDYYIECAGPMQWRSHILGVSDGLAFLYGPCLYLYVRALAEPDRALRPRDSIHCLPIVGYSLIYLPFFLTEASRKREVYEAGITTVPFLLEIGIAAKLLSLPFYLVLVFRRLRRHDTNTEQYYSNKGTADLHWLRNLAFGMALFWLFIVGILATDAIWDLDLPGGTDALIFLAVAAGVVALGYFGFRQGAVFTVSVKPEPSLSDPRRLAIDEPSLPANYQRSGLKEDDAREHVSRLQKLMENERLYLDSELTIEDIAQRLEISRHHLTQVLNGYLGKNFYLFVNEYRVAEARRGLVDPKNDHLTLLAIGLESGFNAKSSFNSVFKRLTSMTPSQYRRSYAPDLPGPEST